MMTTYLFTFLTGVNKTEHWQQMVRNDIHIKEGAKKKIVKIFTSIQIY